jgi:hypothetical protein
MCICTCSHFWQTLTSLLQSQGVFQGSQTLIKEQGDVCLSFALQYFLSQVLLIVAALGVVFINTALKVRYHSCV